MRTWRLIIDEPADGFYNMAADEFLLNQYRIDRLPILRLYSWKPACISIGYNQNPQSVLKHDRIPWVRRLTGGAAILHDNELTYSVTLSQYDLNFSGGVKESYKYVCGFLLETYRRFGLSAEFAGESLCSVKPYGIFCFSTNEQYDIVVDGKKIGGNAQRRSRDIIFQHGSIPRTLKRDDIVQAINECGDLTGTAGVCELAGRDISLQEIERQVRESFEETFDIQLCVQQFDARERAAIEDIQKSKYDQTAMVG